MISTIKGTTVEGTPEEIYKLLQMMGEKEKREKGFFNKESQINRMKSQLITFYSRLPD